MSFPAGFFDRYDDTPDPDFYASPRLVTHIDDRAIAEVGAVYEELGVTGDVLDLMSSWISHLRTAPRSLTVLGLNEVELAANRQATARVVQDLNAVPALPFADASFDAVVNCVSVDYLVRPVEVLAEVARDLRRNANPAADGSFSERQIFERAIDRLAAEVAASEGIEKAQALERMSAELRALDAATSASS